MIRQLERLCLQAAIGVGALVPVAAGLAGIVQGPGVIDDSGIHADLDSHYRYLSGLLLGIGFGFWSVVPRIEARGARMRVLVLIVVIGGVARLLGLVSIGMPPSLTLAALAMELVVTPLLGLWQARVARRATGAEVQSEGGGIAAGPR